MKAVLADSTSVMFASGPRNGAAEQSVDHDLQDATESDTRRSLRDMGGLLALPALWVDHEPPEIATGLLSVLFGVLRLDGAYARFNDPDGGAPLESWRPSGGAMPAELVAALHLHPAGRSDIVTNRVDAPGTGTTHVTSVRLTLPWASGVVLVSARRRTFPTLVETQLLRMAIGQGAIAIHTARRLIAEGVARATAEKTLVRQNELLRSFVTDLEPSLAAISQRLHEAAIVAAEIDQSYGAVQHESETVAVRAVAGPRVSGLHLTPREIEVLGLLAQGLSNKEIAGVIWLSDRTVERHITSVYRKIGVARRSEATAFALRHRVV